MLRSFAITSKEKLIDLLVRAEITTLAVTPVRDAAPNGMLMGKPMNVANVVTLDIPVATLIPLEQAFNQIS